MDFDPCFVYYTVMNGSKDQTLDLSIWTDIHTHTHTHTHIFSVYLQIFLCVYCIFFMQNVLNANPRYN